MNNIKIKAIVIGTAVFAGFYTLHILIYPLMRFKLGSGDGSAMFAVSQMLGVATCFISGYVAARIAGERGFFYGFNVGSLGTVLSALAAVTFAFITGAPLPGTGLQSLPFWLFVNGSLAGFAGLAVIDMVKEGERELEAESKKNH